MRSYLRFRFLKPTEFRRTDGCDWMAISKSSQVTSRREIRNALFLILVLASLIQPATSIAQDSKSECWDEALLKSEPVDFNKKIYFKHKLEFALDAGWLPNNIPFIFDPLMGEKWARVPLDYTLVPFIPSLRWHWGNVAGPSFIRGNTDLTFSLSYTDIPRGPEHLYTAFMFGVRRNFVQPNWRIVPYVEARGGVGYTDAKGPEGVLYAQGEDLTFNLIMAGGARYNFNSRYSLSAGIAYMHVSNAYLSQPKVYDYGINVFGPTLGITVGLGKLQ
jgi:Lipid A 3-O-deacylase (PagL)